ncbi:MAG: cytidine deaminase [Bacteroidales bacterium]|nr:cytidine deaminase [Bacteroidales bacterium]
MKTIKISADVTECSKSELNDTDRRLVQSAEDFLSHAYAPYSKFSVSAAALLDNGVVVNGTNQENAASPSGTCAERTTVFYANSMYPTNKVVTLAISAFFEGQIVKNPITPCGSCRQVLLETEKRYNSPIRLILAGRDKCLIVNSISDILPLNFDSTFFD